MHFHTSLTASIVLIISWSHAAGAKSGNNTVVQSNAAFNATAVNATANAMEPMCFTTCANTAATSIGCGSIANATCWCTKEEFVIANARCTLGACPNLATNTTLTNASFMSLEAICKKAVGDKFNLTVPTAAQIGAASASGSNNTKSTSMIGAGKDAAYSLQPPMAHIVSASLALTAIVAGTALLV